MRSLCILFAQASLAILLFSSQSLFSQTPAPAFEVASIKPAPSVSSMLSDFQSGKRGMESLRSNENDARVDYSYISMKNLLMMAYGLKENQIVGPDWMNGLTYEIHAKIPDGAKKEQLPEMMQSLLKERFGLNVHREQREKPVYGLVIAKDGHKLKAADAAPADATTSAESIDHDKSSEPDSGKAYSINTADGAVKISEQRGTMRVSGGKAGAFRVGVTADGGMSMELESITMPNFAELLSQYADKPVVDMTGLTGKYHVLLEFSQDEFRDMMKASVARAGIPLPAAAIGGSNSAGSSPGDLAASPSGGGLFRVIQKLGLKFDSRKMKVETLVVDSFNKVPTEN